MVLLLASTASGFEIVGELTDCLFEHECGGDAPAAPVPEPGAALAFATGLVMLGIGRKRSKRH